MKITIQLNKMVKIFVVYDTKYGNTKLVAETIVEGMRETAISGVEEVDLKGVADYDAILIGSPNHWGGPIGGIKKLIDELGKLKG
ncbi:MAG: flavodoxin family protein [Thermoproteota archaeon]